MPRSLHIVSRSGQAGGAPPSKRQQQFNRLIAKVAQLKRALQAWEQALPAIHTAIGDYQQREAEHARLLGELVRVLDRHATGRGLTLHERGLLADIICHLTHDLAGDDAEIKAIYNRHSERDFDADVAAHEAFQARAMQSMLEDDLDFDFGGADFTSLEDLERAAREQASERLRADDELRAAEEERRARRKKSPRQVAAEARRAAETAQIGKSLQEVYRKLAVLLHPDLEQDPVERARKTELMQQVNAAYDRKDLLALLELRLRFEQVDEAAVHTIADDRLAHFNRLLTEQAHQLQAELATVEAPWRHQLELAQRAKLAPPLVQARIRADLADLASAITNVRRDLARLVDLAELRAWLRAAQRTADRATGRARR